MDTMTMFSVFIIYSVNDNRDPMPGPGVLGVKRIAFIPFLTTPVDSEEEYFPSFFPFWGVSFVFCL